MEKMRLNKKSQYFTDFMRIAWIILIFGLLIFMFLFFTVGFKQIFSENILAPTINSTLNAVNSTGKNFTTAQVNDINNFQTMWDIDWFNYDIFFLVWFIGIFTLSVYEAAQIKAPNFFSFSGLLTIGTMIFLLLLTIVGKVRDYLILNFYTNLFNTALVSTPLIDWFITNIQLISFIWFIILILVSLFDWGDLYKSVTDQGGQFQQ